MVGRLRTLMLVKIAAQYRYSIGVHSAAVLTSDNKALLFSAPSGFDKSTLPVFLALNGNDSLGNDSLVVDLDSSMVVPFPASAKWDQQSIDILGLDGNQVSIGEMQRIEGDFETEESPVQLFAPSGDSQVLTTRCDAKALLFPKYDSGAQAGIKALDVASVFSHLTAGGVYWNQCSSTGLAKAYINFVAGLNAYELNYTTVDQARDLLLELDLL